MGNRANYILKKGNDIDIYYTHWRAVNVTRDLTLGQKRFCDFVREFDRVNELLNEPWIEACVLLNFDNKKLTFWENETLFNTSIREEYLNQLAKIWTSWSVYYAEKEMFEIEKELGIEYSSMQKIDLEYASLDQISDFSENDEYISCLVILRENNEHSVKYVKGVDEEEIALIGEQAIGKLKQMKSRALKKENSDDFFSIFIIDIDTNTLWINQSINGLEQELRSLWKNWNFNIGNFGYLELLKKIGIDTIDVKLTPQEIQETMQTVIYNRKDDFDPNELANKLVKDMGNDLKFNEHFFQNIKPKETFWSRIKGIFTKK